MGCLKDEKFCDRMNDYILFKDIDDKYVTLPELLVKEEKEEATDENGEKVDAEVVDDDTSSEAADENAEPEDKRTVVYYVTDKEQQGQYIKMFKEQGLTAVILDHNIDTSFISQLEQRNETYKFARIDADVTDSLVEESADGELDETTKELTDIFQKALSNDKLDVKVAKFKNKDVASMLTVSEESRRMQDMMKMYNMYGMDPNMFPSSSTLVLNANNELVDYILNNKDGENVDLFAQQLYDLAAIANAPLSPEEMTKFIERSNKIMMMLAK